ncbi:MAG: zinc ribbon domain-containing protein [Pyrinomonadaceae bacterium]
MHCPQCGQQQIPGEVRFCSRCGFPLSGVSDLIANGGTLPPAPHIQNFDAESPKKRGVKQGVVLFMGVGIVLTSILGVFSSFLNFPEFFPALSAVVGFLGGFLRIVFALIFEEGAKKVVYLPHPNYSSMAPQQYNQVPPAQLAPAQRPQSLPPAQNVAVGSWRRPNTAELVTPSSVTENTTKLLEREPPPASE